MNRPIGFLVFAAFLLLMVTTIAQEPLGLTPDHYISTEDIGMVLFTEFLVPFEILSVILLAAMIGAIYLGRQEVSD